MIVSQIFSNDSLNHCNRHSITCNWFWTLFQIVCDCTFFGFIRRTGPCNAVMTQWSVKIILVFNTDLFKQMSKIGLYLVFILRNWSVFSKMFTKIDNEAHMHSLCSFITFAKVLGSLTQSISLYTTYRNDH